MEEQNDIRELAIGLN